MANGSEAVPSVACAIIRMLSITRYRGIESLRWHPGPGINIILGGGDLGKTTILDAISLLLTPSNYTILSDADYWRREVDAGFEIEAVLSIPDNSGMSQQVKMNWPWLWDGTDAVHLLESEEGSLGEPVVAVPVYRCRVRGTPDLELVYEVVQPDESCTPFSIGMRRAIGLVRLPADDRNDRDLRLVHGSGLDRLLADQQLRSRLGAYVATEDLTSHLTSDAKNSFTSLQANFEKRRLPGNLGLGVTGGPGLSLNALIGLTAETEGGVRLPLANWGAGTRRLSALAIAAELQTAQPITVVDELERGLEPYRQRMLMSALDGGGAQAFITTHSASVVGAISGASLWYVDSNRRIGQLEGEKVHRQQRTDPEMFLARLAIVCEGATEVGFALAILERALGSSLNNHGIRVTDGGGHDASLELLEALAKSGLSFAGVVDNEGRFSGRWSNLKQRLGDLLLQWPGGCLEEQIIPCFDKSMLRAVIEDPEDGWTGMRVRTLTERLESEAGDIDSVIAVAGDRLVELIIAAATGVVPEKYVSDSEKKKRFQSHKRVWFKSVNGGRELADKVFTLGAWPCVSNETLPFINAVRGSVDLSPVSSVS